MNALEYSYENTSLYCVSSHSASDKYMEIIEKKGSQDADEFQCLISGTLTSGELAWAISTN